MRGEREDKGELSNKSFSVNGLPTMMDYGNNGGGYIYDRIPKKQQIKLDKFYTFRDALE